VSIYRSLVIALLAAALCACVASAPASAETLLTNPPPGANDRGCKPTKAHPNPVVLVHGLGATMGENWGYISPILAGEGYCVFALTYGVDPRFQFAGGVIPIQQSAHELGRFVKRVRRATGARKIDLVGHSEGTFMPEYWLKYLGGARFVRRYVAMTPLYRGTTLYGLSNLSEALGQFGVSQTVIEQVSQYCASCPQFLANSGMVKKLNKGGAAVTGVAYTTIPTRYDELVVPYTSGILNAPNVTNHVLQDVCPTDTSEHAAEAFDPVVAQLVVNALDPPRAKPVSCA
jgi:triacylglycerol lipase